MDPLTERAMALATEFMDLTGEKSVLRNPSTLGWYLVP
jgi:hypothetical protein